MRVTLGSKITPMAVSPSDTILYPNDFHGKPFSIILSTGLAYFSFNSPVSHLLSIHRPNALAGKNVHKVLRSKMHFIRAFMYITCNLFYPKHLMDYEHFTFIIYHNHTISINESKVHDIFLSMFFCRKIHHQNVFSFFSNKKQLMQLLYIL